MAIKFSQFVLKTLPSELDYIVGYTGTENLQITPDNFLAPYLGAYLPLAGGTMTGTTNHGDNVYSQWGTGTDFWMVHNGSNTLFQNETGDLQIHNNANDKNIIFKCDDGAGGVTPYLTLDGSAENISIAKTTIHPDSIATYWGDANDLQLYHNSTDSHIDNYTGNLNIVNNANDGDINFYCDDGAGGVAIYLTLDGSLGFTTAQKQIAFQDNVKATFGGGDDLQIYHDGSNSYITDQGTGRLIIKTDYFEIDNAAGTEAIIEGIENGAVNLYYDSAKKLESTATGIQVTDEVSIGTSLVHTGDTDTKVSFGTDEIVLTTAGTDRMTVESDGKIQVGSDKVIWAGGYGGGLVIRQNNATGDRLIKMVTVDSGGAIANDNVLVVKAANVGIGIEDPLFKLQVSGSVALDVMPAHESEGIVRIGRYDANTTRYNDIKSYVSSTAASNYLKFSVHGGVEGATVDVMTLLGDGKVGIGSGSPTSYNSRGQDLVIKKIDSDVGISIVAEASGATEYSSSVLFADGTGGTASYRGIIEYDHADDSMAFSTAAVERMRITSTGLNKINSSTSGNHEANYKTGTYYKLSTGSTTAMTMVKVGHTHAVNYTVIAKVDTSNVGTLAGNTATAYGGNGGIIVDSEAYAGVVTDIAVTYDNSYYGLSVAVTYTGATAPHIWMAVKGQSSEDFVAQ